MKILRLSDLVELTLGEDNAVGIRRITPAGSNYF